MEEVLARGRRLLEKYEDLTDLPSWVYNLNFEQAELQCDLDECGEIVTRLRDAEHSLREGTAWDEAHKCADTPTPRGAADEECAMRRMLFAATRLALGAAIEAANAKEASIIAPPGARKTDVFSIARLYNDAFLASVWTSAHAMYISQLQNGFEEPSAPGLFTVPNAYSIFDLNDLFARRTCPRQCPKGAQPLLHVLMRSTYAFYDSSLLLLSKCLRIEYVRWQEPGIERVCLLLKKFKPKHFYFDCLLTSNWRVAGGTPCSRAPSPNRWRAA